MIELIKGPLILARRFALLNYRRLAKPKVVRHCGVKIAIDRHLSPLLVRWIYAGDYEKSELKAIRRFLEPDDVVLEVGAGLGFISIFCAKLIGDDRVHAFEANPTLQGPIRRNYELNGTFPHLEIGILGDRAGEEDFFIEEDFWASSTIQQSAGARVARVPVKPIDDVIRAIDPSFLILDIEGGEYDLFRALGDFHHIRKVAIELHEEVIGAEKVGAIKRRLAEEGFSIDADYTQGQQLFARRADVPTRDRPSPSAAPQAGRPADSGVPEVRS